MITVYHSFSASGCPWASSTDFPPRAFAYRGLWQRATSGPSHRRRSMSSTLHCIRRSETRLKAMLAFRDLPLRADFGA